MPKVFVPACFDSILLWLLHRVQGSSSVSKVAPIHWAVCYIIERTNPEHDVFPTPDCRRYFNLIKPEHTGTKKGYDLSSLF